MMYSGKVRRAELLRLENGTDDAPPDDVPNVDPISKEISPGLLAAIAAAFGVPAAPQAVVVAAIRTFLASIDSVHLATSRLVFASSKAKKPIKLTPSLVSALGKAFGKPDASPEDIIGMIRALLLAPPPSGPVVNAKHVARMRRAIANLTEGEVRKCRAAGVPIGTYAQLREGLSRAQSFDVALDSLKKR